MTCSVPCNILKFSAMTVGKRGSDKKAGKTKKYHFIQITFQKWIQINVEKKLYPSLTLFAEVGGYVGIFIGYSLLNLVGTMYNFIKSSFKI